MRNVPTNQRGKVFQTVNSGTTKREKYVNQFPLILLKTLEIREIYVREDLPGQ
jgi:hypothetical protein